MEKWFKILLISTLSTFALFMLFYSPSDEKALLDMLNQKLPTKLGTIGTIEKVTYSNKTLIFRTRLFGDSEIKNLYEKDYDTFKELIKYSFLIMNGQSNFGNEFTKYIDKKTINICFIALIPDGDSISWNITSRELKNFVDSCKNNPTETLKLIIDKQLEVFNYHLPIKIEDLNNPIRSVVINSIYGDLDSTCLPQSISQNGDDIIMEYEVDETIFDIDSISLVAELQEAPQILYKEFTSDPDMFAFLKLVAMSHSNFVIKYKGRDSSKTATIKIPYSIIKTTLKY